ncbi:MAG: HU family DNA-binding protein [Myxococcota bacterium]|nr:HU family DNA-binding protein [Myxococcota bacterium]
MSKMTKSQIVVHIAGETGISRKNVGAVFDALRGLAKAQLGKKGPGEFAVLPGLIKAKVRTKPAVKAGKWFNPFTKQEEIRKAKPARRIIRLAALKALKDAIG